MRLTRRSSCAGALALAATLLLAGPSWGVILYPDADLGVPAGLDPNVVGRWGTNASCVVIGSQYVISTRHQGNNHGPIVVGGVSYAIDSNFIFTLNEPNRVDLQILWLPGAGFTQYVNIATTLNFSSPVVIGGYGQGRGSTLYFDNDSNIPFGYNWDGSPNTTLRWGQNKVEGLTYVANSVDGLYSKGLYDRFDANGTANYVANEAALGNYDSGSGWFQKDANGRWTLVGLGCSVDSHHEFGSSWFMDPNDPGYGGDYNSAVRIYGYTTWINSVIPEPATLALLGLGAVALIRRRRSRRG